MTKRMRATVRVGLMVLVFAGAAQVSARVATETQAEPVKVTVKYTGKGDVDATHRLWIWLFDTPNLQGAIPVAELSLEKNGDTAAFANVTPAEVWIAVAYDEKGGFYGSAPPPTGSPVALYGATKDGPGKAVTPGAKAHVTVTFDESVRMP